MDSKTNILALLTKYKVKRFDKVPSGYPFAGATRYKRELPKQQNPNQGMPFVAFTVCDDEVVCCYNPGTGGQTTEYNTKCREIENFLTDYIK